MTDSVTNIQTGAGCLNGGWHYPPDKSLTGGLCSMPSQHLSARSWFICWIGLSALLTTGLRWADKQSVNRQMGKQIPFSTKCLEKHEGFDKVSFVF